MSSLLVLVAHNGRTLQLDVQPSTRVDSVQQALVSSTGVAVADQIVMFHGGRLDGNKTLSVYKLPVAEAGAVEENPVFVYCRAYLKHGAVLPPPEVLPPLVVTVPPLGAVALSHPLHSASSPLVRALPDYERQFQHHLLTGRTYWDASQQRVNRSRQLLSEQEVQARGADAARANVEAHYTYICNAHLDFLARHGVQHASQSQLLSRFHDDLSVLASVELHPALHTERWTRLSDLQPPAKLREWYEHCRKSRDHFGAKVAELEQLFDLLKRDVESLFMQAPSVDLDRLGAELSDMEGYLDEHSSSVQVLSKDLKTVKSLVEDIVRQLGGQSITGSMIHDACGAMESIHDSHVRRLLPRMVECDNSLEAFSQRALVCKNRMSRDVVEQLQRISAQQSRIRDMKNKLAAFNEVLGRQDAAFAELTVVGRLPIAYRSCLAECVRRRAWHDLYTGQAVRVAEHMARVRDKEVAKREAFLEQVERFMPAELLGRAGLLQEAPHCQISIPTPAQPLLHISVQDLQRMAPAGGSSGGRSLHEAGGGTASLGGQLSPRGQQEPGSGLPPIQEAAHQSAAASHAGMSGQARGGTDAAGAGPGSARTYLGSAAPATSMLGMEMENARLRAELANHITAACLRDLAASKAITASSKPRSRGAAAVDASSVSDVSGALAPAPRLLTDADAVSTLQHALAMKDDLAQRHQREISSLHARNAAYERRIAMLEELIQGYAAAAATGTVPEPATLPHPSTLSQQQQQQVEWEAEQGGQGAGGSAPLLAGAGAALLQQQPGAALQEGCAHAEAAVWRHLHGQTPPAAPLPVQAAVPHPTPWCVSGAATRPVDRPSTPTAPDAAGHPPMYGRYLLPAVNAGLGLPSSSSPFADSTHPTPSCTQILPPRGSLAGMESSALLQAPSRTLPSGAAGAAPAAYALPAALLVEPPPAAAAPPALIPVHGAAVAATLEASAAALLLQQCTSGAVDAVASGVLPTRGRAGGDTQESDGGTCLEEEAARASSATRLGAARSAHVSMAGGAADSLPNLSESAAASPPAGDPLRNSEFTISRMKAATNAALAATAAESAALDASRASLNAALAGSGAAPSVGSELAPASLHSSLPSPEALGSPLLGLAGPETDSPTQQGALSSSNAACTSFGTASGGLSDESFTLLVARTSPSSGTSAAASALLPPGRRGGGNAGAGATAQRAATAGQLSDGGATGQAQPPGADAHKGHRHDGGDSGAAQVPLPANQDASNVEPAAALLSSLASADSHASSTSSAAPFDDDVIPDIDDVAVPPGAAAAGTHGRSYGGGGAANAPLRAREGMRGSAASSEHMSSGLLTAEEPPDEVGARSGGTLAGRRTSHGDLLSRLPALLPAESPVTTRSACQTVSEPAAASGTKSGAPRSTSPADVSAAAAQKGSGSGGGSSRGSSTGSGVGGSRGGGNGGGAGGGGGRSGGSSPGGGNATSGSGGVRASYNLFSSGLHYLFGQSHASGAPHQSGPSSPDAATPS